MNNNRQIYNTLNSQLTFSDSYINIRNREENQIRKFIKEHNDYKIYTNKSDNFITLIYKGIYYTFNGFSKSDFLKIYKQEKGEDYAL